MVGQQFIGTRIFQELTGLGYTGSLTTVYRYLRQFQDEADNKATIRFESLPGKQMQYDWKEWQVSVAGRPLKIYFHQAILSYSRYKFVTFSLDISTPSIIRVLTQALVFFQGVPAEIVIDNPKQLVLSHDRQGVIRYKVVFQETFPALAPDFIRLAEQSYALNASYHLNKILDLLSVYEHQAVAAALQKALELGTPSVSSVQALLPEKLQQPALPTSCRTAGLPAVAKRPLSLSRASYEGGAL